MNIRKTLTVTLACLALLGATGCAVTRGQETVGAYVDDTVITSTVKSRFVQDEKVSAAAISVETLNGTVLLSGFAKSATERTAAETIARQVNGVKLVKNEIAIRP
jgi:hyperosmotically inducible protein